MNHLCALTFIFVPVKTFDILNSQYFVDNEDIFQPLINYHEDTLAAIIFYYMNNCFT